MDEEEVKVEGQEAEGEDDATEVAPPVAPENEGDVAGGEMPVAGEDEDEEETVEEPAA